MKSHYVQDLIKLNVGDVFASPFRLSGQERREKKDGSLYLALQLVDRTGSLEAKWWDCTEAHCTQAMQFRYAHVEGKIRQFGGRKEVHLQCEPSWLEEPDDVSIYEFAAPLPLKALRRRLDDHIQSVHNFDLKTLLVQLFSEGAFLTRFELAPAAQYRHHAFQHGLLQHTVEVADLALGMAEAQAGWGYRSVSRDLTLTGALLHDIGKVDELTWSDDAEPGMSRRGHMVGHIVIGIQRLSKAMNKIAGLSPALKDALMHIVVSHHGKKEFGSPIVPLFPEAQIVHMADLLDTQLFYMQEAAAGATEEFVKVAKLDKQLLYTPAWDNLESASIRITDPAGSTMNKTTMAQASSSSFVEQTQNTPVLIDVALLPSSNLPSASQLLRTTLPSFQFRTSGSAPSFATRRVPLIGQAAAGQPILAAEHIEDTYEVEAANLPADRELFLLRVSGDSMTGDGIADGDLVIVKRQENQEAHSILVVYLEERDEVAIKRIERSASGTVHLLSSNPEYPPIPIAAPAALRIRGKLLGIVRNEAMAVQS